MNEMNDNQISCGFRLGWQWQWQCDLDVCCDVTVMFPMSIFILEIELNHFFWIKFKNMRDTLNPSPLLLP